MEFLKPLEAAGYAMQETMISPQRFGKPMNRQADFKQCSALGPFLLKASIRTHTLKDKGLQAVLLEAEVCVGGADAPEDVVADAAPEHECR